jgi:hypothetical protein
MPLDREKHVAYCRNWRTNNKDKCCRYSRRYRLKNRTQILDKHKEWELKNKITVLLYYSNNDIKCACCGEKTIEFMTLNHINGGGSKHRRELKKYNIYDWLIRNNFPDGFNVLCMNCNFALGMFGYCPHADKKEVVARSGVSPK